MVSKAMSAKIKLRIRDSSMTARANMLFSAAEIRWIHAALNHWIGQPRAFGSFVAEAGTKAVHQKIRLKLIKGLIN